MSWSSIIGQQRVKSLLVKAISNKMIAHAYLFYGPDGIGKDALALEFAKTINCREEGSEACDQCESCISANLLKHPNIQLVYALPLGKDEKPGDDPIKLLSDEQLEEIRQQLQIKSKDKYHQIEISKGNFIKINSIRDIKRKASLSASKKGKKIFLILHAEKMNVESSNSLLKILEEPLSDTIFILTTSKKEQLLPTIISRCQVVKFDLLQEKEIEDALVTRDNIDRSTAALVSKMAGGSYSYARRLCSEQVIEERKNAVDFINSILSKNGKTLIEKIEELLATKDKKEIGKWLIILESWLHDTMLLQHNKNHFLDDSEKQSMESIISKFPNAKLNQAIDSVEKAIAHLDKNVYLPLVITCLANELRTSIMESSEA